MLSRIGHLTEISSSKCIQFQEHDTARSFLNLDLEIAVRDSASATAAAAWAYHYFDTVFVFSEF